jgi:hypothetical protein
MGWTSDNVTEVALIGLWSNNHEVVNVLHVRREEDDPAASARDVLNNWQDHIVNGPIANNYVLQGARYRDRNSADGVTGFLAPDPAKQITGTNTSSTLPPQCALLVHKRVETTATQRAGRFYLPATQENEIDEDGRLSSALITAINANLSTFLDGVSGPDDNELVVVHGTGVDAGEKDVSVVTALTIDPVMATQRRRLR